MTDNQEIEVEEREHYFHITFIEQEEVTNLQGKKVELEDEKEIEIPKDMDVVSKIISVLGEYQLSQKKSPAPKSVSQRMDEAWDAKLPDGASR